MDGKCVQRALRPRPDRYGHIDAAPAHPVELRLAADGDAAVLPFPAPVFLELPHRRLVQASVPDAQLAGQRHLPEKGQLRGMPVHTVPELHPRDHDPPPVRRQKRLRRVKVEPVVDRLLVLRLQPGILTVEAPDQAQRRVSIDEFRLTAAHLLRAREQNVLPVEREEIRALPHPAPTFGGRGQRTAILPAQGVFALIQEDRARAVGTAVPYHGMIPPVLPPELRVAEVPGAAARRQKACVDDGVCGVFLIIDPVAEGEALGLVFRLLPAAAPLPAHAGIHEKLPPVGKLHGAAGKAAVAVILLVRGQGAGQALPADEVLRFRVAPVHGAPVCPVGVVLEKQMIFPPIDRKAVRVVDPADAARQMKRRQKRFRDLRQALPLILARAAQKLTFHPRRLRTATQSRSPGAL